MATPELAAQYPLPRERNLILGLLLVLAAIGWAIVIWQAQDDGHHAGSTMGMGGSMSAAPGETMRDDAGDSGGMSMDEGSTTSGGAMSDGGAGAMESGGGMSMDNVLTMDMSAGLFLGVWVAMMAAMMFPTAAPMILTFGRVHASRQASGRPFVPTWVFVATYLGIWTLFGVVAFVAAIGADSLAGKSAWLTDNAARIGGGVLIAAGLYQLSPLKRICLTKCRTPFSFILSSWRDGWWGTVRMGAEHGTYCLGCCWMLFVILFPLGMMNVAAMALITLLIFAEKSLSIGRQAGLVAAFLLIAWGTFAVIYPDALPTTL